MTTRRTLPQRRHSETFSIRFWNDRFHITVGYYDDHATPGEVFIAGSKSGVQLDSVCRDGAVLLSLAMQHGVSIETIAGAITRNTDGSPSTIVGAIVDRLAQMPRAGEGEADPAPVSPPPVPMLPAPAAAEAHP